MQTYYDPSTDEIKVLENIQRELITIATEKFKMKNCSVKFNYPNGLHFERMQQSKDISVTIYNTEKEIPMRIMISYGLLIYYQLKGKEKVYVKKLKDIVKYKNVKIKKGRWIEIPSISIPSNEDKDENEDLEEDLFDKFVPLPDREYIRNQEGYVISRKEKTYPWEKDEYLEWIMRQEYCKQFREMHGTDSIEVSDNFYLF